MRRTAFSNAAIELSEFIIAYPIFCFFIFISVILLLITVALYFGAFDFKWEKRCAAMLVLSMVPVCVWMFYFYYPVFSPLLITIIIWMIYLAKFLTKKNKLKSLKQKQQAKIKGWTCKNCKNFNEDIFLVCKQCNITRIEDER